MCVNVYVADEKDMWIIFSVLTFNILPARMIYCVEAQMFELLNVFWFGHHHNYKI